MGADGAAVGAPLLVHPPKNEAAAVLGYACEKTWPPPYFSLKGLGAE
jgi:hypothetical protein